MTIHTVPADLQPAAPVGEVLVHDYRTSQPLGQRCRTILTHHTFSLLRAGEKTIWLPGTTVRLTGPVGVLLPAGNCLMAERLTAAAPAYHSTLLFFNDVALRAFAQKYPEVLASGAGPLPTPEAHFRFEIDDFLAHFVAGLACPPPAASPAVSRALRQLQFEELMLYLAGRYPRVFPAFVHSLLRAAPERSLRAVVEAPGSARRTLDELAFLCHMSVSTFKRHFEQQYGMPAARWFHERRMREAAFRLRHEQARASEIHAELGYETLSSFIQAFKKVYGITPKAYQQRG